MANKPRYSPEEAYQRKLESVRKAGAKWRAKNDRTGYHKDYDSKRPLEKRLVSRAKTRANEAGLPFNITEKDVVIPCNCPICGTKMESSSIQGGSSKSPTLDKVIPSLGYVKGNVAVICKLCNSTKGSGSADLHRKIADYIDSFR